MSKGDASDFLSSRVFTTDIGIRLAEPCSLSVVATHQVLTQIFEYICLTVLHNHISRDLTGAVITYKDLQTLERCNKDVIHSLERIVGADALREIRDTAVQEELKEAGDLWADHVLENARAYIMSIVYIVVIPCCDWNRNRC
jgi:myosin-crossreactive antigen